MKNRHLWLRIAAAELPEALEAKIREEFSWSDTEAAEAIEEYRRFVYLNQVADHPLSPPREVDLVWHMHLLFTRHYWGPWSDMLDTDMHHEPARVGTPENAFWEDYGATRELYQREFGKFARETLWPSVAELQRRERAGSFAFVCFASIFIAVIAGIFTQNSAFFWVAVAAFVAFFIAIIAAGSKNGGRASFGVSSGSGGGDGGCGD